MRTFSTYGPVNPQDHYVVSRTAELADFIKRVKLGRYIVIFAPRQTGKTTFFQWALDALAADTEEIYFPIEEVMRRGMDALEKELNPIEVSRFIAELRRMKSGVLNSKPVRLSNL